ncbi:hypothetical protein E2C01_084270 [Portunus trituberculatus]|uniref:Uncharacterized protein n=1 Tax=Portunus trituberculatus TaxID=210409 RepID=A0A5B7IXV3_PORTR|nr:hypothetical protein [Portunus trituberculatus]
MRQFDAFVLILGKTPLIEGRNEAIKWIHEKWVAGPVGEVEWRPAGVRRSFGKTWAYRTEGGRKWIVNVTRRTFGVQAVVFAVRLIQSTKAKPGSGVV